MMHATRKILRGQSAFSVLAAAVEAACYEKQNANGEPLVIIALDCSGSMGADFGVAVNGCRLIQDKYFQESGLRSLEMVTFGEEVRVVQHTPDNYVALLTALARKPLEGATWMSGIIDYIRAAAERHTDGANRPMNVIFLTDGQNTKGSATDVERSLSALSAVLCKQKHARIDCIGFTSGHDVRILNRLVSAAGCDGSFQYAKSSAQLPEVLAKLATVQSRQVMAKLIVAPLNKTSSYEEAEHKVSDDGPTLMLTRSDDGADATYEGTTMGDSKIKYTHLQIGKEHRFAIEVMPPSASDLYGEELDTLVNKVTGLTNRYAKEGGFDVFRSEVMQVEQDTETFYCKVARIKERELRRSLMQQSLALKAPIASLMAAVRASGVALQGDRLASLLAGAHSVALNRSMAKRVDKRMLRNLDNQSVHTKALTEAVDKIKRMDKEQPQHEDENKCDDAPSSLWGEPQCVLSLTSAFEAPLEGDCLALCLSVGRSPATAMEPSLLSVRHITSTHLSLGAFMEGVEDALIRLDDAPDAAAQVIGDFKRGEGSAFRVLAHEKVNAVLPLFVNERHWSVARHRLAEAMSLACVGNPLSSTFSQIATVPFLLLMNALQRLAAQPSENHLRVAMQIYETCKAIVRSWNLRATVQETVDQLCRDPMMRTVDAVPHYGVLLARILCCVDAPVKLPANFLCCVVDEAHRRAMSSRHCGRAHSEMSQLIQQALGIDLAEYTHNSQSAVESQSRSGYYASARKYLDEKVAAQKKDAKHASTAGSGPISTLGADDVKAARVYEGNEVRASEADQKARLAAHADPNHGTMQDVLLFDFLQRTNATETACKNGSARTAESLALFKTARGTFPDFAAALAHLGVPHSMEHVTALVVQSLRDSANVSRRTAVQAGQWHDPWTEPRKAIVTVGQQLITERQAQLVAAAQQNQRDDTASLFGSTDDLVEAAGCVLHCAHIGNPLFPRLIRVLQQRRAAKALAKWHMLQTGYAHTIGAEPIQLLTTCWIPSSQNGFRFRAAHPQKSS